MARDRLPLGTGMSSACLRPILEARRIDPVIDAVRDIVARNRRPKLIALVAYPSATNPVPRVAEDAGASPVPPGSPGAPAPNSEIAPVPFAAEVGDGP